MTRNQETPSSPQMRKTRSMQFWQERKSQWRRRACLVVRLNGSPSVNRPRMRLSAGRKNQWNSRSPARKKSKNWPPIRLTNIDWLTCGRHGAPHASRNCLITISADSAADKEKALKILTDRQCSSQNLLFDTEKRDDLFDNLDPQSEGGVPYTVLIAPGGEVIHRQHGSIDAAELKRMIVDRIGRTFGDDK